MLEVALAIPYWLELAATIAGAIFGALSAVRAKYDIFGVCCIAIVVGLAGGITRDILLQDYGIYAFQKPNLILACIAAGIVAFYFGKLMTYFDPFMDLLDNLSVALWAIIGTGKALSAGLDLVPAVILGTITANGGGIVRDICMNREPEAFQAGTVYVSAAFIGALAVAESALLVETIEQFTEASALEENTQKAHEIEHEGDTINHKIFKTVATDFITPIDREDIIEMCQALDDIVDDIEDVMLRFYMYDIHFMHDQAIEFAKLIQGSCEALDKAMCDFRNFKKSKNFVHLIVKVHDLEEQADQLYTKVIRDLHVNDYDNPMRVQVWTNLFDSMEACCDACELAADVMNTIMLKNV